MLLKVISDGFSVAECLITMRISGERHLGYYTIIMALSGGTSGGSLACVA